MFESIVLRNSEEIGNVTWGAIAEALLFYQTTRVIIGYGTLVSLASTGHISDLVSMVAEGRLQAVHCEETLGTMTTNHGASQAHDYGTFTLVGDEEKKGEDRATRVEIALRKTGIDGRKAKIQAKAFVAAVPRKSFTGSDFVSGGIVNAAREDIKDLPTLNALLKAGLAAVPGGYDAGDALEANYVLSDLGYFLFSSIDYESVNLKRSQLNPSVEPLTPANLLTLILESRADMHLAAFYGGDFVTTSAHSALVRWRQQHLLQRSELNSKARQDFSEILLPDFPSIRTVIDRGEQSFADFLRLLQKAQKFKLWLAKTNPDEKLVSQYIVALKKDTWAEKAPAKAVRYLFSLVSGFADPTGGVATGAADTFLLDKLWKGWRPNHFIDDRLKPFLGLKDSER